MEKIKKTYRFVVVLYGIPLRRERAKRRDGEGSVVIWAPNARHSPRDLRASINPFLYFLVSVSNWYFAVGMQLVWLKGVGKIGD